MSEFSFQIITPESIVFEATCREVDLPGSEGRFGVLAGHMNFVSSLTPGVVTILSGEQDKPIRLAISDGFADVTPERCVILVEMACGANDVDAEKIKKRMSELTTLIQTETGEREKDEFTKELQFWEAALSL